MGERRAIIIEVTFVKSLKFWKMCLSQKSREPVKFCPKRLKILGINLVS